MHLFVLGFYVVTGLEFWAPSDSVGPPIGGYGVRLMRLWWSDVLV